MGDDRIPGSVLLNPLRNFGKVLILLTYVIFLTQVDEINNRFGAKKE